MNPTKFYNITNESLLACSLYQKNLDYVRPHRRRRGWMSRLVPFGIAVLVGVGYSALKLAGG